LIAVLAVSPAMATTHKTTSKSSTTKTSTTKKTSHHSKSKYTKTAKKSWKSKGQKTISSDRTRQIQEALIREHYLDGDANGVWDNRTQEAMRSFQAKQGWQTKVLPDSRALIKLGLGPDHSDVLNPETAATSPFQP
jgi:peptidoglycan hydrolase-like protein with peptidoglycan-binding domain